MDVVVGRFRPFNRASSTPVSGDRGRFGTLWRRSLLGEPGLDQGFAETRRRADKAWLVRIKPRRGELGIYFHRLGQRGLRLRRLVRGRVERRKGSVTERLSIPQVDGFEAFLDRRIVSTQPVRTPT